MNRDQIVELSTNVGKSCFQRAMDPDSTDEVAQDEENSEEMLQ